MFYVEESKDSYLMTSCRSAMNSIDIEDVSYCNRLAIEIVGNIDPSKTSPRICRFQLLTATKNKIMVRLKYIY